MSNTARPLRIAYTFLSPPTHNTKEAPCGVAAGGQETYAVFKGALPPTQCISCAAAMIICTLLAVVIICVDTVLLAFSHALPPDQSAL